MGLSAVCAYNLSTAEAVFSRGKYMQSATVEQSHNQVGALQRGCAHATARGGEWAQASPWERGGLGAGLCFLGPSHQHAVSQPLL